jgi:hypothetical protein
MPTEAYEHLSPAELQSAITTRAYHLWIEAGRPRAEDQNPSGFFLRAEEEFKENEFYHFKKYGKVFVYRKDGATNIKEALSFVKDWITSLIQLEVGALGVFGLAAGFSNIFVTTVGTATPPAAVPSLSKAFACFELLLIILSGLFILLSIAFGLTLLNSLPGAMQRLPVSPAARRSDVFSISNEPFHWSIFTMAREFRRWFFQGVIFFSLFVLVRMIDQFYRTVLG